MTTRYSVLGIMSGSSLDGLDLAFCSFQLDVSGDWHYEIIEAETIPYPEEWRQLLIKAPAMPAKDLVHLHARYGRFVGKISKDFLNRNKLSADFISAHGHTIFHQPEKAYTFQLGEGQALASASGLRVICDYRSKDISLGGQGAPLVPIGDELLYSEYPVCLNIGGIANLSFKKDDLRIAFDVCPANQLLNTLSYEMGLDYDEDGKIARSSSVDERLLARLNQDPFYGKPYPKSLSNECVRSRFISILDKSTLPIEVKVSTVTAHIAQQLAESISALPGESVLVTGGGAHNTFLIESLSRLSHHQFNVPEKIIVDFKEALVFAFLGVLRIREQINCLSSVTGARQDTCGGQIFNP